MVDLGSWERSDSIMDHALKAVTFKCRNASIAYKLNSSIDWSITEKIIRKSFEISPSTEFQLVDLFVGKIIAGQLIPFLSNEAIIEVQFLADSSFDAAFTSILSNESKLSKSFGLASFDDAVVCHIFCLSVTKVMSCMSLTWVRATLTARRNRTHHRHYATAPAHHLVGWHSKEKQKKPKKSRDAKILAIKKTAHFPEKYCEINLSRFSWMVILIDWLKFR